MVDRLSREFPCNAFSSRASPAYVVLVLYGARRSLGQVGRTWQHDARRLPGRRTSRRLTTEFSSMLARSPQFYRLRNQMSAFRA